MGGSGTTRVVGAGIDLIELDRVAAALGRWEGRLIGHLMDDDEAARMADEPVGLVEAVAFRIALKEASSKAIGTGWTQGVRWRDVSVSLGSPPRVELRAKALEVARRLGSTGAMATAVELRRGLVYAEALLLA